jgi:hypothetical protein
MGSAGECSQAQLRARFRDNNFTLPPGLLDLLRLGLERAEYTVGDDDLADPYFGPDRKVTLAEKTLEIERTLQVEDMLYLLHIPASILRRARQEGREAIGYLYEIFQRQEPGFRVLVFSVGLNVVDRAFKAMFDDWAGPELVVEFVPWDYIEILREQDEKAQDRQIKFILTHFAWLSRE